MRRRARGALSIFLGLFLLSTAAGAALAGPAAAAEQPSGSIGIRLVDAPTSLKDDPRARLYIVDRLAPGDKISRRLELSNTDSKPVYAKVYASAASVTNDAFMWADGQTANELTQWTSLDSATVTIPAHSKVIDTVHVDVPDQVSSGERYGVIWAQVASKPATAGGVQQISRVGVRMYVSIGNGNVGAANFTLSNLAGHRASNGAVTVTADVHNTGGRALDFTGSLGLSEGPGGASVGPVNVTQAPTIAPGDTRKVTVPLDRALSDGPWTAKLTLKSELLSRTISGRVQFIKKSGGLGIGLLILIVAIALALIILIVALDRIRRNRRDRRANQLRALMRARQPLRR